MEDGMKRVIVSLLLLTFAVSGCVAYPGWGHDDRGRDNGGWSDHGNAGPHQDDRDSHNQGR
jgi:hypothetical protein